MARIKSRKDRVDFIGLRRCSGWENKPKCADFPFPAGVFPGFDKAMLQLAGAFPRVGMVRGNFDSPLWGKVGVAFAFPLEGNSGLIWQFRSAAIPDLQKGCTVCQRVSCPAFLPISQRLTDRWA